MPAYTRPTSRALHPAGPSVPSVWPLAGPTFPSLSDGPPRPLSCPLAPSSGHRPQRARTKRAPALQLPLTNFDDFTDARDRPRWTHLEILLGIVISPGGLARRQPLPDSFVILRCHQECLLTAGSSATPYA